VFPPLTAQEAAAMMAGGEGMDMTSGSEDGDDDEGEPF